MSRQEAQPQEKFPVREVMPATVVATAWAEEILAETEEVS